MSLRFPPPMNYRQWLDSCGVTLWKFDKLQTLWRKPSNPAMKHHLDHLLVGRAEQQRRHAEFARVLASAKPAQKKKEPPTQKFFDGDHERLRWMRDEYQARCERAPAWASRGMILRRVAGAAFGIDEAVLASRRRGKPVASARQQAIAFASLFCGWSSTRIGHVFGRDHSTVIYSTRKYRALVEEALNGKS